jgi:hypothetical protein
MSLERLEELTKRLQEMEEFIDEAVNRGVLLHAGKWSWHIPSGELKWDSRMHELFSSDEESFTGDVQWFLDHLYPCDRERIGVYLQGCAVDGRAYAATYRTYVGDRIHAYGNVEGEWMSGVCLPQTECHGD